MKNNIIILIIAITLTGCATRRNQLQNVQIIKPFNETAFNTKKILIINQLNNYNQESNEKIQFKEQYLFNIKTKNFYKSTAIFTAEEKQSQNISDSDYDYVLINDLKLSKSELPLYHRIMYGIMFMWFDKRTFYLTSTFKDIKNKKQNIYDASDTYYELGMLVVPILPLLGKSDSEIKQESFENLNTIIFNKIYSDYSKE